MSRLASLFRRQVELPAGYAGRVATWKALPGVSEKLALEEARFVVVDVETSGLDPRRNRLLSIGACALEARQLRAGENYQSILRCEAASERENILIHGISPQAQATGQPPEESLMGFLEFVGKQPLLAFHAGFDQLVLDRHLRSVLGVRLTNGWIDLAQLAPALIPEARLPGAALDEWLAYAGLRAHTRHSAVDDAFVTGELFLVLLARARARALDTVSMLLAACEQQKRLAPNGGAGGM